MYNLKGICGDSLGRAGEGFPFVGRLGLSLEYTPQCTDRAIHNPLPDKLL